MGGGMSTAAKCTKEQVLKANKAGHREPNKRVSSFVLLLFQVTQGTYMETGIEAVCVGA